MSISQIALIFYPVLKNILLSKLPTSYFSLYVHENRRTEKENSTYDLCNKYTQILHTY